MALVEAAGGGEAAGHDLERAAQLRLVVEHGGAVGGVGKAAQAIQAHAPRLAAFAARGHLAPAGRAVARRRAAPAPAHLLRALDTPELL